MAVQTVEERTLAERIDDAAIVTEALAREIFGDAAYLRRSTHENPETGEELPSLDVHYCFENWEEDFERLERLHNQFMDAYVRIVTPGLRSRIVLNPIPTDAD